MDLLGMACPMAMNTTVRRVAGTLLMGLAFAWLAFILGRDAMELVAYFKELDALRLAIGQLFSVTALLMIAWAYTFTLSDLAGKKIPFSLVVGPYFLGQIGKYLPGKIWGIFYQAHRMKPHVAPILTWMANVELMVLTNFQSLIAIVCVLLWLQFNAAMAMVGFAAGAWTVFILLKNGWVRRCISGGWRLVSKTVPIRSNGYARSASLKITFCLALEWFFFIAAWSCMLPKGMGMLEIALVSVSYVIAWMAGFAAFVVPSGLFVREAVFVWVGGVVGLDQTLLAFYGLLARVFFMISDVLAMLATGLFLQCFAQNEKEAS